MTLTATVEPADEADQTVTWESSNPSVATVNENGRVTAVNPGTAEVTATTTNNLKATATITVTPGITTSVDEIEASESSRPVEVYSLDGIKVGDSLDNLPKGFYIVRQGGSARKIRINE